ncbi:unnamed protein product [Arctia plantaginis]|uniref:Tripeptidyl-peptidase 2 n=1 Tax=Arctia plantaginis TaxID=874455 RepID=A0A8S1A9F7_ARCPL|nr:unnamed protein product [Arctia plantaginis]
MSALISGLKARHLPYSPYSVKRALENSATYLTHVEPWAQGCGLLNIEKAFDLLSTYYDQPERDVFFNIQCGSNNAKGILLRPKLGDVPKDVSITIEPHFLKDHCDMENARVIPRQIAFGVRLALAVRAEWVSVAQHLDMMNAARPLNVRLRTDALPPGPHFASILAYDVSCIEKGPVFRIPITVLQPQPLLTGVPSIVNKKVNFKPATIVRHFVVVPPEATWGVLRMSTEDKEKTGRFLVHTMQLMPNKSCRCHETQKMLNVGVEAPTVLPFQVVGGVTLEIAIAKYWANIGELELDYGVEFHGLAPDCGSRLVLGAGEGPRGVVLRALRLQDVQPAAQLKYSEAVTRPTDSRLAPLSPRDRLPPARQIYQLLNTYVFHVAKATEVSPIISLLCDMLYESEFESQMWMLYNSCKQLMAVGDAYPSKYSVKLEKGDYTLRLNIRHENKGLLEKLQDLPAIIQQRLQQPITVDVYCSQSQALTGGKKFSSAALASGTLLPLYFTSVPAEKISRSSLSVGQTLTGSVTFAKDELGRRVDSYALQYVVCEAPRRAAPPRDKDKPAPRAAPPHAPPAPPHDEYMDALKDFTTGWLAKLEGDKLEQVYEELQEKFPGYLGAHVAYLHALDSPTDAKKLPHANEEPDVTTAWCEQLITISEKVIKAIDQDKLLAYLGMKNDTRSDANKIKQEQEKSRGYLVEALCRLRRARTDSSLLLGSRRSRAATWWRRCAACAELVLTVEKSRGYLVEALCRLRRARTDSSLLLGSRRSRAATWWRRCAACAELVLTVEKSRGYLVEALCRLRRARTDSSLLLGSRRSRAATWWRRCAACAELVLTVEKSRGYLVEALCRLRRARTDSSLLLGSRRSRAATWWRRCAACAELVLTVEKSRGYLVEALCRLRRARTDSSLLLGSRRSRAATWWRRCAACAELVLTVEKSRGYLVEALCRLRRARTDSSLLLGSRRSRAAIWWRRCAACAELVLTVEKSRGYLVEALCRLRRARTDSSLLLGSRRSRAAIWWRRCAACAELVLTVEKSRGYLVEALCRLRRARTDSSLLLGSRRSRAATWWRRCAACAELVLTVEKSRGYLVEALCRLRRARTDSSLLLGSRRSRAATWWRRCAACAELVLTVEKSRGYLVEALCRLRRARTDSSLLLGSRRSRAATWWRRCAACAELVLTVEKSRGYLVEALCRLRRARTDSSLLLGSRRSRAATWWRRCAACAELVLTVEKSRGYLVEALCRLRRARTDSSLLLGSRRSRAATWWRRCAACAELVLTVEKSRGYLVEALCRLRRARTDSSLLLGSRRSRAATWWRRCAACAELVLTVEKSRGYLVEALCRLRRARTDSSLLLGSRRSRAATWWRRCAACAELVLTVEKSRGYLVEALCRLRRARTDSSLLLGSRRSRAATWWRRCAACAELVLTVEKSRGYLVEALCRLRRARTDSSLLLGSRRSRAATWWRRCAACAELVLTVEKSRGYLVEALCRLRRARTDSSLLLGSRRSRAATWWRRCAACAELVLTVEKSRGYLVEALCRKGTALCRLRALAQSPAAREKISEALANNLTDLLKFADLADTKAIHYGVWHCFTFKQWGRGIKLLNKIQEERPSKEVEERLIEAYNALGWGFYARWSQAALPIRYPATYRPF